MKFTVNTKDITDAVGSVAKIIKGNTVLAIIQNVLIEAKDGIVKVRATDISTTIERTFEATVETEGQIAVNGRLLAAYLAGTKVTTIDIALQGHELTIRAGNASVAFPTMPANEFPGIPEETIGESLRLNGRSFRSAIQATGFAASTEEARGASLQGTLLRSSEQGTVLVCTDGYRLATQTDHKEQEMIGEFIVPTGALAEAARNSGDADLIEITILGERKNQMRLTAGRTTIYVQLIDGAYPKFEAVMPKEPNRTVTFKTIDMLDSLRRTSLVAGDLASMILLDVGGEGIRVSAASDVSGRAEELIEAKLVGEPLSIRLNSRYLKDILNHITADTTVFELTGEMVAVIIRPETQKEDIDQKYILMPLRN